MTLAKGASPMDRGNTFLALQPDGLEIMLENIANLSIPIWDMDTAKVPTGGGTVWEVPDINEGAKAVKTLEGIILHCSPDLRDYYRAGLDEGGEKGPPDCHSEDGVTGVGDPGGDCATCEFAQWGSAEKGEGQACKLGRRLFLLMPNAYLPLVVRVPTMSVGPLKIYLTRLASNGIKYYEAVTSLSLEKSKQRHGSLEYSKMVVKRVRGLEAEELEAVKRLAFRPKAPQLRQDNQRLND